MKNFKALCTPDLVDLLHQLKTLLNKQDPNKNSLIDMHYEEAIGIIQRELDSRKPPHPHPPTSNQVQQHSTLR